MKLLKTRFFTMAVAALVLALTLAALPVLTISAEETAPTNIALGKTVTATNSMEGQVFFSAAQLTDGKFNEKFVATEPLGWHIDPANVGNTSVDNPITIDIDLAGWYEISSVTLIPMCFYETVSSLPRDFDIQVTTDGTTWTTVHSETDVDVLWGADVRLTYEFETVKATQVRLNITKESNFNGGYTTLGELEVYGVATEAPETEPETTVEETTVAETTVAETTVAETTSAETTGAEETTAAETTVAETTSAETTAAAQSSAGCFGLVGTGAAAALVVLAGAAWVCRKKD